MEDLNYIISLGFSGADIPRAVIIAFTISLLFAPRASLWKLGFGALAVDRLLWPLVSQAASGAGWQEILGSLVALGETLPDDLGMYMVRYFGLFVMIALFTAARTRLHAMVPSKKATA